MTEGEKILYAAVTQIVAVGEDIPDNATRSYIEEMWGGMVRSAQLAKDRFDRLTKLPGSGEDR